jgi:zinc transport system permease protein
MLDIFHYAFMNRALVAGLIIACIAPAIGNFLMMKKMSIIADTLAHLALIGVALGVLTHQQPMLTTILVTVAAAWLIDWLQRRRQLDAPTVLAMLLPTGLAVSLVLISWARGFNSNLFSYLFGSISTVSQTEIWPIVILGFTVLGTLAWFYQQLLFVAFDPEGARAQGIAINHLNLLLMTLTAITVALSMKVVGALLVSALMVIPSATGAILGKSFRQSFIYSLANSMLSVIVGLSVAFYFNVPAGAAIVLVAIIQFVLAGVIKNFLN